MYSYVRRLSYKNVLCSAWKEDTIGFFSRGKKWYKTSIATQRHFDIVGLCSCWVNALWAETIQPHLQFLANCSDEQKNKLITQLLQNILCRIHENRSWDRQKSYFRKCAENSNSGNIIHWPDLAVWRVVRTCVYLTVRERWFLDMFIIKRCAAAVSADQ